MSARLYLPTTVAGLRTLVDEGGLPPSAVSPDGPVRAEADDEESEYAALMTAADLSAALCVARGLPAVRRVVVVVEPATTGAPGASFGRAEVAAVHLDTEDRAADADPDDDLAWFAPEELEHLL
ncbi:DUF6912 family protein [Nocardioides solisilvae]|uniref:DUF6912 family protein n=1 Tax=Nocardioides solisilvae TaxID=1542435 RepID=UPI000D7410B0|nr:hypothetical protein [Nocardioides solisilvae]